MRQFTSPYAILTLTLFLVGCQSIPLSPADNSAYTMKYAWHQGRTLVDTGVAIFTVEEPTRCSLSLQTPQGVEVLNIVWPRCRGRGKLSLNWDAAPDEVNKLSSLNPRALAASLDLVARVKDRSLLRDLPKLRLGVHSEGAPRSLTLLFHPNRVRLIVVATSSEALSG